MEMASYANVFNVTHKYVPPDYDEGTSPVEVYSLTFFVPLCSLILWSASNVFQVSSRTIQLIEMCSLNFSLLVALTLLNQHLETFFIVLLLIFFALLFSKISRPFSFQQIRRDLNGIGSENVPMDLNTAFIGGYRGHLLLATCICILAVDFNIFPFRFAKTETYGWSIMDAGVGSFVLLHGLCSSHGKHYLNTKRHGLKKCLLSSLPLFVLGCIRLIVTNAVGYHKVVPEYGVHWNFFFTLAFTKMICYTVLDAFFKAHPGLLAVATLVVHQLLLSKAGLIDLVLSEVRTTFFEANKEGICSLLGFVSLYFCGVQLGRVAWKKGSKIIEYVHMLLSFCAIGVIGWILMYVLKESVQPVSRRMANLSYCVWVVSLTSLQLALHLFQELVFIVLGKLLKMRFFDFMLWKVINYNGLGYFLLANLLTGLVNISTKTKKFSNFRALSIMMIYLMTLTTFSVICYKRSIVLKFW